MAKIKIDKDLLIKCKKHAQEMGYSSVEEFIVHTLEKELGDSFGKLEEDDKEVKARLKGLGYID